MFFSERNEQPVVQFQSFGHDLPKEHVLFDALPRRLGIVDGVARAGVQLGLIVTRGSARHAAALDHGHARAAQR